MFACRLMSKGLVEVFGVRSSDGAFFCSEMAACNGDERDVMCGIIVDVIVGFTS